MTQNGWNPWKITAIGMAVVVVTAVVTGLVVANWTGAERDRAVMERPSTKVAEQPARPARVSSAVASTPSKNAIEACNRYAASEAGAKRDAKDKTVEDVLNEMAEKFEFGWFVKSDPKDRYDGWIIIRKHKNKERGYEDGKEPKKSAAAPVEGGIRLMEYAALLDPNLDPAVKRAILWLARRSDQ